MHNCRIMEGSEAVALAVKACRPQVISAFPISPQTHIVEHLSEIVADGHLDAEFVPMATLAEDAVDGSLTAAIDADGNVQTIISVNRDATAAGATESEDVIIIINSGVATLKVSKTIPKGLITGLNIL